jgi:hypothetical protein
LTKFRHFSTDATEPIDEMFKGHCFPKEIILQAVYFKLRFSMSYRDVEEL